MLVDSMLVIVGGGTNVLWDEIRAGDGQQECGSELRLLSFFIGSS